ncbi:MAG: winged helix-turn-helix domain-containing protein [Gemmatimonadaceae bacterium]
MADSGAARRRSGEDGATRDPQTPHQRRRAPGFVELDSLIHHRMRLGIVSALAANESMSFNELKALLRTTDGNLSVHARKLEEAQYLTCTKRFEARRPHTEYRLTATGRRALQRYLDHMEAIIDVTRLGLDR